MAARTLRNLCEVEVVDMGKHLAGISHSGKEQQKTKKDGYMIYVYMTKQL
jgi:hypothetical protein